MHTRIQGFSASGRVWGVMMLDSKDSFGDWRKNIHKKNEEEKTQNYVTGNYSAYGFEMHLSRSLGPFILSIYLPSAMWVF